MHANDLSLKIYFMDHRSNAGITTFERSMKLSSQAQGKELFSHIFGRGSITRSIDQSIRVQILQLFINLLLKYDSFLKNTILR